MFECSWMFIDFVLEQIPIGKHWWIPESLWKLCGWLVNKALWEYLTSVLITQIQCGVTVFLSTGYQPLAFHKVAEGRESLTRHHNDNRSSAKTPKWLLEAKKNYILMFVTCCPSLHQKELWEDIKEFSVLNARQFFEVHLKLASMILVWPVW